MSVDVQKLLNEVIPAALAKNAADARTINARYQLNITGAGEWFIDVTAAGPTCTPGTQPADCTITVASADFQKLVANPDSGMALFFTGKLKVAGNQMLAVKLSKVLTYT